MFKDCQGRGSHFKIRNALGQNDQKVKQFLKMHTDYQVLITDYIVCL